METNDTFRIATFGLSAHESRVLQTICIISRNRPRTYELARGEASGPVDFAIVDKDDPQAMVAWRGFQAANPMVTPVMLAKTAAVDPSGYQIGRPIMATRLLVLLDHLKASTESPAFSPGAATATEQVAPYGQPPEIQHPVALNNGSRLIALVVDDSLPIRRQMELELAPFVGRVDLAEDGERALELVGDRPYDIVFLDVVLPGMDGYKICRTIKRDKRTKQTPVIMLTGKSSPFDRVKGKLAGCDTYLTKPVDHATFEKVVNKYLSQAARARTDTGNMLGQSIPGQA